MLAIKDFTTQSMAEASSFTAGSKPYSYKYKNNCLKLKCKVGMAVLKVKQNKISKDNQHIRSTILVVHPYAYFSRQRV